MQRIGYPQNSAFDSRRLVPCAVALIPIIHELFSSLTSKEEIPP
jgi:hypothetical protein